MIGQYCGGAIPNVDASAGETVEGTLAFVSRMELGLTLESYESYDFSGALQSIWRLIAQVDSYLTEKKPWSKAKDPALKNELEEVLYNATEALRFATILAAPVIPQAAARIWKQLGQSGPIELQRLDALRWGQLKAGTRVGPAEPVFPRVDHKATIERIIAMEEEALKPAAPAASSAPATAPATAPAPPAKIGIDDFTKVEMRVGQVKSAERVAGADKLLKVMVDIGEEVRQVVAGIAEVYKPEELVGRKVVLVVNLQARKLRGVESNGMIVAASVPPDGKPVLAGFLEDVPVGARLK
jgi:methionyl-tRNA synthetase